VVVQVQIIAKCPNCGKGWLLKTKAMDCRVRCRACGLLFKVPQLKDMPKAAEIIKRAKGEIYVDEDGNTYG
jgi:uncharacterized Zn finger protein